MDFESFINKNLLSKPYLSCICCLDEVGPYVLLSTCRHKEFLDSFRIHDLKSPEFDKVCCKCHELLKKITQFKEQVQKSFDVLMKKVESESHVKQRINNLEVSAIVYMNIPELIEENPEMRPRKMTRLNTVETALNIINTNTKSLQSLTAYNNFACLTQSLIEATIENLAYPSKSSSVLPDLKKNKETASHHCKEVESQLLPDLKKNKETASHHCKEVESQLELKKEQEIEIVYNPIASTSVNNSFELGKSKVDTDLTDELKKEINTDNEHLEKISKGYTANDKVYDSHDHNSVGSPDHKQTRNFNENKRISVKNGIECIDNNNETTVLPVEIKMESVDVSIVGAYGMAVLPDIVKCDPEIIENSRTVLENCLGENVQEEYIVENSTENDDVGLPRNIYPTLSLIPIRLSTKRLRAERHSKLNSREFRQWQYQCVHCIIGFQFKENLEDHMKRKHVKKRPESHVSCKICRQVIMNIDLRKHMFRHYHRIQCKQCKKQFVLFDEAYDHYCSAHTPLSSKGVIKRQLQMYWKSKALKHNEK